MLLTLWFTTLQLCVESRIIGIGISPRGPGLDGTKTTVSLNLWKAFLALPRKNCVGCGTVWEAVSVNTTTAGLRDGGRFRRG
jgi:hypothetical protein